MFKDALARIPISYPSLTPWDITELVIIEFDMSRLIRIKAKTQYIRDKSKYPTYDILHSGIKNKNYNQGDTHQRQTSS